MEKAKSQIQVTRYNRNLFHVMSLIEFAGNLQPIRHLLADRERVKRIVAIDRQELPAPCEVKLPPGFLLIG